MGSRGVLTVLAALTGATLTYAFISFTGAPPQAIYTEFSTIAILLVLACLCAAWYRIFTRRPNPRSLGE